MVTFTLPEELRALFFGPQERLIHDLFFTASSRALADTLAMDKALRAQRSGFTGVLHTWNQRLHFHPHIHYIVPGAGIDEHGGGVTVKSANFLVPLPILREAFRRHFQSGWEELKQTPHWQKNKLRYERRGKLEPDPGVWDKDWGVHIKPFGDGANAIKYLGRYVCRSAISDARIVAIGDDDTVTFRWKDRAQQNRQRTETIPGETFVMRYLQHVLPSGVRAIRRFGFCHPAAKADRERIAFHTGKTLHIGPTLAEAVAAAGNTDTEWHPHPPCPCCQRPRRIEGAFNKLPCEVRKILLTQLRALRPSRHPSHTGSVIHVIHCRHRIPTHSTPTKPCEIAGLAASCTYCLTERQNAHHPGHPALPHSVSIEESALSGHPILPARPVEHLANAATERAIRT
ncbi:MAG: transposase [Verrucomicrobiales bacterium]